MTTMMCSCSTCGAGERYANGHIPGARNFSVYGVNTYDSDPAPLASFTKMWAFQLVGAGILPRGYSWSCAASSLTNRRPAHSGFSNTSDTSGSSVLDGGVRAWRGRRAIAHPRSRHRRKSEPVSVRSGRCPFARRWTDVVAAVDDSSTVILDTRYRRGVVRRGRARYRPRPGRSRAQSTWSGSTTSTTRAACSTRRRCESATLQRGDHYARRRSSRTATPATAPRMPISRLRLLGHRDVQQLRRVVAGVGESHGVSDRRARARLNQP